MKLLMMQIDRSKTNKVFRDDLQTVFLVNIVLCDIIVAWSIQDYHDILVLIRNL